jgi:hypothetical protein
MVAFSLPPIQRVMSYSFFLRVLGDLRGENLFAKNAQKQPQNAILSPDSRISIHLKRRPDAFNLPYMDSRHFLPPAGGGQTVFVFFCFGKGVARTPKKQGSYPLSLGIPLAGLLIYVLQIPDNLIT